MKTICYTLIFSLLFISCSSDDTDNTEEPISIQQEALVATWNLTGFEFVQEKGSVQTGIVELPLTFTSKGSDFDFTYKLSDNPKKSESKGSFTIKSTIKSGPQETPIEDEIVSTDGETVLGTWEYLEENKIQITEGDEITIFEIVSLSETTLKMRTPTLTEDDIDLESTAAADVDFELEGHYLLTLVK